MSVTLFGYLFSFHSIGIVGFIYINPQKTEMLAYLFTLLAETSSNEMTLVYASVLALYFHVVHPGLVTQTQRYLKGIFFQFWNMHQVGQFL